jgi:Cof subfamily protein (haloacid dehalogenase superfamily)
LKWLVDLEESVSLFYPIRIDSDKTLKCSTNKRGERRIRLVFADIDGTLIDSNGALSTRTSNALRRIEAEGARLVLCTGRSRTAARKVAAQVGGQGYGIVLNGALIIDWITGRILHCSLLPASVVRTACEIARAQDLAAVWLGTEEVVDYCYVERGSRLWPEYEARNRTRIRYVPDLAALSEAPASLAAYASEEQADTLVRCWRDALEGEATAVAGPTPVYHGWYVQLTAAGANKAAAAAYLADHLGVHFEQTLAIGDHLNDVGLLKWAGTGVCMGDGHPDARQAADYITGTLLEDGAAWALERFVLGCS